ncbi:MAG: hypothetical protein M1830_005604 [Pleopsidium flavum]|nr:MAG: hypothetical protein M1830_005604 [Pleopsidium flavum]
MDDNMPLSFVSSAYSNNTKEKKSHPFVQLSDSNSDKEGRLVIQPNSDGLYRTTGPEDMSLEADERFPNESIRTKSDTEWPPGKASFVSLNREVAYKEDFLSIPPAPLKKRLGL